MLGCIRQQRSSSLPLMLSRRLSFTSQDPLYHLAQNTLLASDMAPGYSTLQALLREEEGAEPVACDVEEMDFNSYQKARVASIFVIFITSLLGAVAPILFYRLSNVDSQNKWLSSALFFCRYFGSGVIIGTAWMHLMSPAIDALRDPCLESRLGEYDWAMAISLMTIMGMFGLEMLADRLNPFGTSGITHSSAPTASDVRAINDPQTGAGMRVTTIESISVAHLPSAPNHRQKVASPVTGGTVNPTVGITGSNVCDNTPDIEVAAADKQSGSGTAPAQGMSPHDVHHSPRSAGDEHQESGDPNFAAQMTAVSILEFGIIFHSIFIGLMLAVADNFVTIFIVIVFHQAFEGLGLGSRFATMTWAKNQWLVPYFLALFYALSTPVAIAIGLGIKSSLERTSQTSRLVHGIFDAVSGGILMYTGLVELLAHDFLFNPEMKGAPLGFQFRAYGLVCLGAGIMAALAKWA